jgi:hypothetical protein
MTSRLAYRLRRVEERAGLLNEVDTILDSLDGYQSRAIMLRLVAFVECQFARADGLHAEGGPSDEDLRQPPLQPRARYEQVLASIPEGTFERLLAAFIDRVARKEAA